MRTRLVSAILVAPTKHAMSQKAVEVGPRALYWFTSGKPPWFRSGDYDHALDGLHKAGWRG